MHRVLRLGWRFIGVAVINSLSLMATVLLVPGIAIERRPADIVLAVLFSLLIGLANALVRPMLVYMTIPVNILSVGLPTILLDSFLLLMFGSVSPGFRVDRFWPSALLGAVVLPAVNILLTSLTDPERQRTLYDFILRRLGRTNSYQREERAGRGIIFIQIDGLSYPALVWALKRGRMPVLQQLLNGDSYRWKPWNCGVPSNTASFQAGLLYGNNDNIPAFRWFDRHSQRVFTSNHPAGARAIEETCARPPGLLAGGSSINTLLKGGANRNAFTVSLIDDPTGPSHRAEDFLPFLLNPYCLLRVAGLALWDLIMECYGTLQSFFRRRGVRVSRRGLYPLVRILSNVVLREVSTYLAALDIMRGVPAIYIVYLGYDEVAHFAGPFSPDVLEPLAGIDNQLRRIRKIVERDAPIPYDLVIFSDHGQSASIPIAHLHQQPLSELVSRLVAGEVAVPQVEAPGRLAAFLDELYQVERLSRGRLAPGAMRRSRRALQRFTERQGRRRADVKPLPPKPSEAEVLVLCSGNLAHLYFTSSPTPLTLEEIEARYPSLIEQLIHLEGIGFILVRSVDRGGLVISPRGLRQLDDGSTVREDPLIAFGDPRVLGEQLRRLLSFPNAGDLIVNGGWRGEKIVTFEEHIGTHGGVGGAQNEPFLIYPADMYIDSMPIQSPYTLHTIFMNRRKIFDSAPP